MKDYLPKIDLDKMEMLLEIEGKYETGELTLEEARAMLGEKVGKLRPYHIAFVEQNMTEPSDDECFRVDMKKTLLLLEGFMDYSRPELPDTHPIMHYYKENDEMRQVLLAVEDLVQYPVIKNQWLEIYDKLRQYSVHFARKQNQLYPLLEKKGFDRPTTTMWMFDDIVRDEIRDALRLLEEGKEEEFIEKQNELLLHARDLMDKEETILYPTSVAMISEAEFEDMKLGDREIGFAFITVDESLEESAPVVESFQGEFASDLQALLSKYGYNTGGGERLDVATGELTLEQINLIYRHLPIDISFVDENELVRFYSDTKHRIFPRSKNVIGREVMNCHPRKSAHVVREVIDKLRSGEQDRAEFWINKPNVFIYIVYVAVRDKEGNFRGVLEMMQDCTRIRSLQGSQTLLSWEENGGGSMEEGNGETSNTGDSNQVDGNAEVRELTPETRLKDLLKQYPYLKSRLPEISPSFKMLNSPLGAIIVAKADIRMMSEKSGIPLERLMREIQSLLS